MNFIRFLPLYSMLCILQWQISLIIHGDNWVTMVQGEWTVASEENDEQLKNEQINQPTEEAASTLPAINPPSDTEVTSVAKKPVETVVNRPATVEAPNSSAFNNLNMLCLCSCLLLCFLFGYSIHIHKVTTLSDAAAAMLVGAAFGICIRMYTMWTSPDGITSVPFPGIGGGSTIFQPDPSQQHLPVTEPHQPNASLFPLRTLAFDPHFFYLVLLPPIVLDAGLSINKYEFLRNLTPIILFSTLGTIISTICIYFALVIIDQHIIHLGLKGPEHKVQAFLWAFSALISATDTVTVLSIIKSPKCFGEGIKRLYRQVSGEGTDYCALESPKNVESGCHETDTELTIGSRASSEYKSIPRLVPNCIENHDAPIVLPENTKILEETTTISNPIVSSNLISILMGESVLNDAVSIALTRSIFKCFFSNDPNILQKAGIAEVIFDFLIVMVGSLFVGFGIGGICCFLFKSSELRKLPQYELAVTLLMSYMAFGVAELIGLSGVVSLFFCGVVLGHYNTENLSQKSRMSISLVFETIALICDKTVFAYIGVVAALGIGQQSWNVILIGSSLIMVILSRALFVFPFSYLTNASKPIIDQMNIGQQVIIWLAGLRGAVAFALAMSIPCDGDVWRKHCRDNKDLIVSTTLFMIIITTVGIGSILEFAIVRLGKYYATSIVTTSGEVTRRQVVALVVD